MRKSSGRTVRLTSISVLSIYTTCRWTVSDNGHFITAPYHAGQAMSNLMTSSLPVISVSAPARTLLSVTDDEAPAHHFFLRFSKF
ncbi:MAG: hypothetical protein IJJ72_08550 [Bacteroidales bacterium]|nr:hypothetical protein [Bacteroidales bacterium]